MPLTTPSLPPARAVADTTPRAVPPTYDLTYRDSFWASRQYEDRCDRLALRALLPRSGERLLDLGAGFGRLADEYCGFKEVTLLDASTEMLDAARVRLAGEPRFAVVEGDAARIPFPDATFDAVVAVRLLVHFRDPEAVFAEVRRVLRPGGRMIVEYPNRRHLLAAIRHLTGHQDWSPTGMDAHEYLEGHFAHQPARVARLLRRNGLEPEAVRAVSLFRSKTLKQWVPIELLAWLEAHLQGPLGPLVLSPAVFLRARATEPA